VPDMIFAAVSEQQILWLSSCSVCDGQKWPKELHEINLFFKRGK